MPLTALRFPVPSAGTPWPPLEAKGSVLLALPGGAWQVQVNYLRIDADGAPNAYHPDDAPGLDDPANAGWSGDPNMCKHWWPSVLVADPSDPTEPAYLKRPYIQPDGEFAGFFVSQTALVNGNKAKTDVQRYLDARKVPYVVMPRAVHAAKGTGTLGDLAAVRCLSNGRVCAAVVGDIGPDDHGMGEVSIALAQALAGQTVSARNGSGQAPGPYQIVVFPRSRFTPAWPVTAGQMEARVVGLMAELSPSE
ncbi:MAG: glycoside hydrolase family 75 protein [Pseudomonadota bacterium]